MFTSLKNQVINFKADIDYNVVNIVFLYEFTEFLFHKNLSPNYVHKLIKSLQQVMSETEELQYHSNTHYKSKRFTTKTTIADTIYLNEDELNKLKNADITSSTLRFKYNGNKRQEILFKKYELVCTHTARRSFATNAYLCGVPCAAIAKITGHTTEKQLMSYIKASPEQNAVLISMHKFFT